MKIAFTGDTGFTKYFKGALAKPNLLDEKLVEFLNDSDITVVNVEGAVCTGEQNAQKPLLHSNPPEIAEFTKKLNGKIWNVANNHINDCGTEGMLSTVQFALSNGCQVLGAGKNKKEASKPIVVNDENGVKVGLVSVNYDKSAVATDTLPGCVFYTDFKTIKQSIKAVKKQNAWCVLNVHAGDEFNAVPLPYIRKIYKKYLKLGADVVIGHHPHVVENYEKVGKKIIFYSLGNFVFDTDYQRQQDYTQYGVLVKIDFGKKEFTFETQGTFIDRQTQTIRAHELPKIFTNIDKKLYKKLWPLSGWVLRLNERVKFLTIYPETKAFTSIVEWENFERNLGTQRANEENKAEKLFAKGEWQYAPKELVEYIKGQRL